MRSDVWMARARWWQLVPYLALIGMDWLWDQIPVLVRRGRYNELLDCEDLRDRALEVMGENRKLRQQLHGYDFDVIETRKR